MSKPTVAAALQRLRDGAAPMPELARVLGLRPRVSRLRLALWLRRAGLGWRAAWRRAGR